MNNVYTAPPKSVPSWPESWPSYHSASDVEYVTDKAATNGTSTRFMTPRLLLSTPHMSNSQAFPMRSLWRPPERPLPRSRLPRQPPCEVEKVVDKVHLYRRPASLCTLTSYRAYRQRNSLELPGWIRPYCPRGTLFVIILPRCVNKPRTAT